MDKTVKKMPKDILDKMKTDFKSIDEIEYIKNKLFSLYSINLNVGAEQLMRSILVIANGKIDLFNKIFDTDFYNDPRDVIMEAMSINDKINYGLEKF
jgi:hypothetical protein